MAKTSEIAELARALESVPGISIEYPRENGPDGFRIKFQNDNPDTVARLHRAFAAQGMVFEHGARSRLSDGAMAELLRRLGAI